MKTPKKGEETRNLYWVIVKDAVVRRQDGQCLRSLVTSSGQQLQQQQQPISLLEALLFWPATPERNCNLKTIMLLL